MKNIIIKLSAIFIFLLTVPGCADWTEIDPKGTNMLQKVSDLDMLLNYRFYGMTFTCERTAAALVGDLYPGMTSIYSLIAEPEIYPVPSALFTWDESIDRTLYTETDDRYTEYYGIIGKICNPIIKLADAAEGDRSIANRVKAEAYILRAWYHYLLVNFYAKAYNPTTAAEDGGIPYSRETDILSIPNSKCTVQEVYDFILEDIDAAFALNSLSPPSDNRMRVNSAFAHAAKAKVLMSLRDYDGAYQAATASLAIENTVDDYNNMLVFEGGGYSFARAEMGSREDLFYTTYSYLSYIGMTPEFSASFETGSIFYNHVGIYPSLGPMYFSANIDVLFDKDTYMTTPGGLSTVDMYLVQAECLIRKGDATNIAAGMDIINYIRRHRIATDLYTETTAANPAAAKIDPSDFYTPFSAANMSEAIVHLKRLTRNEQWYSPKRYISLKRWNSEDLWKETLTKHVDAIAGSEIKSYDFSLTPTSPLWIFPFPSKSTGLNANLTQNY